MSSENQSAEPIIFLRGLSKKYPIYDRTGHKLLELLTLRKRRFHREFWALKNIDLEVSPGITLGIIGENGSGKSTLLQVVAGILQQTWGECQVRGSVAALLELGAGFNIEFTGRENVFMSGVINGLTHRETEKRFGHIVDFAGIGEFIDQPVKTYSSGMFVRLAFSVAIHVDPDILLVDEALAVGDLIFQHRCVNRIRELRDQGKTILFVTHDLRAVTKFCDRAVLLDQGRKIEEGGPEKVVQRYQALVFERESRQAGPGEPLYAREEDGSLPLIRTIPHVHNRYGQGGAEILGVVLLEERGRAVSEARAGEHLRLLISVKFNLAMENPIIGFTVRDRLGTELTATNTSYEGVHLPPTAEGEVLTVAFSFEFPELRPGSYSISPAAAQGNIWEHSVEDWVDNAYIVTLLDTGLIYGSMKWSVDVSFKRHPESAGSSQH
jgi:ABC-type polysaccharide/polyol phosphate transport system ATPase subunit